ncbi:tetratricopeptide repeat protein [Cerasicoccus fimbriatus]|uniref:tetratricopeptide repeat protein n=1 Tax=Cerasicoccus fimbriatus TaxID=3014554 RepID=UPI0022B5C5A7|nr:tetratricopeptide repeat protein [Cerasicoccus sp. TK19100]
MSDTLTEESINQLDPRLRKQIEGARKNLSKNPSIVITVCMNILERHPGCLDLRKLLRQAQERAKSGKTSGMSKFIGKVTSAPFAQKAKKGIEKDPVAVMTQAEKSITDNPSLPLGHRLLGQAAEKLELWETAVFAYEKLVEVDKTEENQIMLANALIHAKRPKEAILIGDRILHANAACEAAQELVRRASVAESMDRGKWEEEGGFRDKLADEEKAIELEQQARVVNDEDTVEKLVGKNLKLLEAEPENLTLYREIINGYRTIGNYTKALDYIRKARTTSAGSSDPTLERMEIDMNLSIKRSEVEALEQKLEAEPDNEAIQAELVELKAQEHKFKLENALRIVEKYPNDYGARYDLGLLFFEEGNYDKAMGEFQKATRNPKVRVKAIMMLGRSMAAKGIYDMAVQQFEEAKKELKLMDETKKEVIYELASAHEENGDMEKAIAEYKIIYSNDIGYRDVADKINNFYTQKNNA